MHTPLRPTAKAAAVVAAALAALTPALSVPTATVAKAPVAQKACFYSRNVDSFSAPNDRTVYLRVGVRNVYEVKLFAPCTDIDWNQRIALSAHGSSWICEGSGALGVDIFTRSPIGRQRCPVTSIHRLSPEELAALPKRDRP
jgi:hypothetical protein